MDNSEKTISQETDRVEKPKSSGADLVKQPDGDKSTKKVEKPNDSKTGGVDLPQQTDKDKDKVTDQIDGCVKPKDNQSCDTSDKDKLKNSDEDIHKKKLDMKIQKYIKVMYKQRCQIYEPEWSSG